MTTKGIILTAIILSAVTCGSFAAWAIPHSPQIKIIYANPGERLDQIIDRHNAISYEMGFEYAALLQGSSPKDYIETAQIASKQVDDLIMAIIKSDIPSSWHASYGMQMDTLRGYSAYLQITASIAKRLDADPHADIRADIARAAYVLDESAFTAKTSLEARPNS